MHSEVYLILRLFLLQKRRQLVLFGFLFGPIPYFPCNLGVANLRESFMSMSRVKQIVLQGISDKSYLISLYIFCF